MSRSSCRDRSRSGRSSRSASSGARTNEPPPRPRRVSTRPIVRSVASASRSVTVETPSCPASWLSAGRRSPSSSRPSRIASASRRVTVSARPPVSSGVNKVRARTVVSAGGATNAPSRGPGCARLCMYLTQTSDPVGYRNRRSPGRGSRTGSFMHDEGHGWARRRWAGRKQRRPARALCRPARGQPARDGAGSEREAGQRRARGPADRRAPHVRAARRGRRRRPRHRRGRVLHDARPVRLGQDDAAAADRRLRAPRRGHDRARPGSTSRASPRTPAT